MNISCAINAGGKALRMKGATKAFIEINNKTIIDHNIEILNNIFDEILIITNDKSNFEKYKNYGIYSDDYIDIGPIAGIHSSLKNTLFDAVFIISSDLPFISKSIILNSITQTLRSKRH